MTEFAQLSSLTFDYEVELQDRLAENPNLLEPGLWIVADELELNPVEKHRVDLLGVGADGRLVVIEVKRANATREAVGQVLDYVSALEEMNPGKIVDLIETGSPHSKLSPVSNFGQQYADRFSGADLSMLTPARITLASTAAPPATERILRYLRNHGVDASSRSFDGYTKNGKRAYRRKRDKRARLWGETASHGRTDRLDDAQPVREPCSSKTQRQDTKGRREIEEIHERAKGYPGVGLFWAIHCLILDAFPEAHEVSRTKRDRKQQDQCGIALTMPRTPADEDGSARFEYVVIRLYPVGSGVIEIFVYARAELRGDNASALLYTLPERPLYLGRDCREDVEGRNFWFTPDTWPRHRANFEDALHDIYKGWQADREAGTR